MTEERRQELDELILNETSDPETQEWRDELTDVEEIKYVNSEDERYDQALSRIFARILELQEERGGKI